MGVADQAQNIIISNQLKDVIISNPSILFLVILIPFTSSYSGYLVRQYLQSPWFPAAIFMDNYRTFTSSLGLICSLP